jgi:uncharacterized membrane protein/protein-disulfide isomerase
VVLAWIAFSVAGYLAFHSVTGTSVAGCGMGSANGCDVVLTSSWSKWLGVPVAVLGLAVYASLASLGLLLGIRNESANRWITNIFVMLAIVAGGASAWFIGVQIFALGTYCKFCLAADATGIVLAILAAGAALQGILGRRGAGPAAGGLQPGLMALRPVGAKVPVAVSSASARTASPPSLMVAFGGAVPLLAILIGGQMLFAAKTYQVEKVALADAIKMNSTSDNTSDSATQRVAMRPTDTDDSANKAAHEINESVSAGPSLPNDSKAGDSKAAAGSDAKKTENAEPEPAHERIVKFLGGKLALDVYKHPIIGLPEAPHIVVEMVSYDCPHCRKMAPMMEQALEHYGGQVAILVMPIPLDKDCNKLITDPAVTHQGACGTARMVIALAGLEPTEFAKFHAFLMSGDKEKPPGMGKIIPKVYSIVNADKLRESQHGPKVAKQLEGYVDLFGQLQAKSTDHKTFGLPVQILGDNVVSGEVEKVEDIYKAWEETLHVQPK